MSPTTKESKIKESKTQESKTQESKTQESKVNSNHAQTFLLLLLWGMNGLDEPVKRGDLNKRLGKKVKEYQPIFEDLEKSGAIEVIQNKRSFQFKLTHTGLNTLEAGLKQPDFLFVGNQVGTKVPNVLLRWIREMGGAASHDRKEATAQKTAPKIKDYEQFKSVVLDVYDELNQGYDYKNLVPIYRIRREIGDRVKRTQFNEWLVEMQANDLIQLMAGEMPDMTADRREDSITLSGEAFRYYVKRLS